MAKKLKFIEEKIILTEEEKIILTEKDEKKNKVRQICSELIKQLSTLINIITI